MRKKITGIDTGAYVQSKNLLTRNAGTFQLACSQIPKIHAAACRMQPREKGVSPFLRKIDKFCPRRPKAWTSHGKDVRCLKTIMVAKTGNPAGREVATIAAPAHMQGSHISAASVGKQHRLAISSLDEQPSSRPGSRHAICFRRILHLIVGQGCRGGRCWLMNYVITMNLTNFRPGLKPTWTKGCQQGSACSNGVFRIVPRFERDVAAAPGNGLKGNRGRCARGSPPNRTSPLKRAPDIEKPGKAKPGQCDIQRSSPSVQKPFTGRSQAV